MSGDYRAAARALHPCSDLDPDTQLTAQLAAYLARAKGELDPCTSDLLDWWHEVNPPEPETHESAAEVAELMRLSDQYSRSLNRRATE